MTKQSAEIVIYKTDLVYAKHAYNPEEQEKVYLGWLIVEPNREVYGLDELTNEEAQEVGLLITRLSRALKKVEGAEHIYSLVIGHHAPQLHIHVVPRYPDTPREYWGMRIGEWPDAPKGGPVAMQALAKRISNYLEKE